MFVDLTAVTSIDNFKIDKYQKKNIVVTIPTFFS